MRISRTFRKSTLNQFSCSKLIYRSTFFPPVVTEDESEQQSTEPSELASQLPDAPTTEPTGVEDSQEPSTKKQKTTETEADDYFVVVDKEDAQEEKPKVEL
jgi:hypothetical protein